MSRNLDATHPKEFSLIQQIARHPGATQRQLSSSTGLSLGMTNILLKRLLRKGYLKVRCLNWNKTQYLLTLKGSMEKARKSCAYAAFVWAQARRITEAVQNAVQREYSRGVREASVVAWPETAAIIRQALAEKPLPGLQVHYVDEFRRLRPGTRTVFTATVELPPPFKRDQRVIPLLEGMDLEFRFEPL